MICTDSYYSNLPKPPPYHPNCRCTYSDFILPDDGGGEEILEKKYFMVTYKIRKNK